MVCLSDWNNNTKSRSESHELWFIMIYRNIQKHTETYRNHLVRDCVLLASQHYCPLRFVASPWPPGWTYYVSWHLSSSRLNSPVRRLEKSASNQLPFGRCKIEHVICIMNDEDRVSHPKVRSVEVLRTWYVPEFPWFGISWSISRYHNIYYTSSTAQGGGGSFKNRKPIGEIGCCESRMAERIHWWTERCLRSPLFLSLSLTIYLPTNLSSMYLSIYLSLSLI